MLNILVAVVALTLSLNSTSVSAVTSVDLFDFLYKTASPEHVEAEQLDATTAIPLCQAAVGSGENNAELIAFLTRAFINPEQYSDALLWGGNQPKWVSR